MKTKFLILVLLSLVLAICSCADYEGFEKKEENGDRYVSVVKGVPLYSDKNVKSEVISVIPAAEKVHCEYVLQADKTTKWYFISWKTERGWVAAEDRTGYSYSEVLALTKLDISRVYWNELVHRYEYEKDSPDKNHEKSQAYYDAAAENLKNNELLNAEKNLFNALYYDVTWARAYYLYAKTLVRQTAPEKQDIISFYVNRALDLGYKYLYKDMSGDNDLEDFSDLLTRYDTRHKLTVAAATRYEYIRKHGVTVSMVFQEAREPAQDYDPNNPDNFRFYVGSIFLGPFADGKGTFLSIDGQKRLSVNFGFELTESIAITPNRYYMIKNNGTALDISLDCRVVRGSESLKDGSVAESEGFDTILIHLENGNDYCESDALGRRNITLDFENTEQGK